MVNQGLVSWVSLSGIVDNREEGLETLYMYACHGHMTLSKFANRTIIFLHQRRQHLLPSRQTWCTSSQATRGPEAKSRKNQAIFV